MTTETDPPDWHDIFGRLAQAINRTQNILIMANRAGVPMGLDFGRPYVLPVAKMRRRSDYDS